MATERKGILTPEQEETLDQIIKLKGIAEKLDGLVLRMVDNKGIDLLMKTLPDPIKEVVYGVVDMIFEILEEIVNFKEKK